jgi:hypothetical protein
VLEGRRTNERAQTEMAGRCGNWFTEVESEEVEEKSKKDKNGHMS